MAINYLENNTRVIASSGHEGRLRVTRRERKLVDEGKLSEVNVLGLDGVLRKHNIDDLREILPPPNNDTFLEKFAQLCEDYNAEFFYTTDDDGIHIALSGVEVFVGWECKDAAAQLRDSKVGK